MLPSQTGRSAGTRSHMYKRGKMRRWPFILIALVLGLGMVFAIRAMIGGDEPIAANAADLTTSDSSSKAAPDSITEKPSEARSMLNQTARSNVNSAQQTNSASNQPQPRTIAMGEPLVDFPPLQEREGQRPQPSRSVPHRPAANVASEKSEPPPLSQPTPKPAPVKQPPATSPPSTSDDSTITATSRRIEVGLSLIKQNKPVEARRVLSQALISGGLAQSDAQRVRSELEAINQRLVFGHEILPNDPFTAAYEVESGDFLSRLPKKLGLDVDWRFLQRINGISSPERMNVGQRLKTVTGPFHAVIDKAAYRLDLYLGSGSDMVFVRSFAVGLGEYGTTPEGVFMVRPKSKLENPAWVNPRTREQFSRNDPKNPIGEHWIGLMGQSDSIRGLEGYGIHGTIEPESIGEQRSMGCVRMLPDDVALIFEVLMDGVSRVEIHGNDFP